MGFRFQKRIKLGKNFGINVSKSGFSPTYRNKRGSISSKGYSIRTGIKGVTYRKTFGKAKNSGCLVVLLFLWLMLLIPVVSCSNEKSKRIAHHNILAYNLMAGEIKKQFLISPNSAIFPDSQTKSSQTSFLGNHTYHVISYVDSQNSFGAMIRTHFQCKVIFNIDGSVSFKEFKTN